MAWDRYHYGLNSPVVNIDPTGHGACSNYKVPECTEIDPDGDGKVGCNESDPFGCNDPDDDFPDDWAPGDDPIEDWGVDWERFRIERARLVWLWRCNSPFGCFTILELAAFLLYEEASEHAFDEDVFDTIARAIRYRLEAGINPETLSGFTAFFNPHYTSTGEWDINDWDALVRFSTGEGTDYERLIMAEATDKMREVFALEGDYVRRVNGEPVIYWWDASEANAPSSSYAQGSSTKKDPVTGELYSVPFWVGSYSQCQPTGFSGCQ